MDCKACGKENRAGRKFCAECGDPLPLDCPACGAVNEVGEKFCGECGDALPGAPTRPRPRRPATPESAGATAPDTGPADGSRKVVSIVFADLVGSTAVHERLDAESARALMERYYQALRVAVEDGGGTVVKLLGDGVMAAFGLRQVAEDDALRAVRAAVAMQDAFRDLAAAQPDALGRSGLRVGVNTGEVVVSGDRDDLIGDPVNVAARLQEKAGVGDVVVGEATRRLVGSRVTLEPLGSVALKGRAGAVAAHRVVSLATPSAVAAAPFVGREDELRRLGMAYQVAVATPVTRLVVLVGAPGLGKSRLIQEFVAEQADEATVVSAHCEAAAGATFAPLARALAALLELPAEVGDDAAREAVARALPESLDAAEKARLAGGIAGLLSNAPAPPEETFFVVRRFLASLAADRPLVLVLDDLQWAEPLLLDLVEHLVQWGSGVPVFVLAGARPELRGQRSSLLATGGLVSDVVMLGGLDAGAAMRLAASSIGADDLPAAVAAKVLATSEGNPLFVSELVRMLVQEGALRRDDGRWIVGEGLASLEMPPTIHALLAARIERLGTGERTVLERASVVGRRFSRGAVQALLAGETAADGELDARLESLRRSELIERDSGWFLGEPGLRFHHVLIRDAAYRRLLKGTRADLHARLADWIEARSGDTTEQDETVGLHLEQARQLLAELGPLDAAARALGERASRRLAAAGRRALARDDVALAANLLGRAYATLEPGDATRAELALDWCEALLSAGDVARSAEAIAELERCASGSQRLEAWRVCFASQLTVLTAPERLQEAADAVEGAAQTLADLGDTAGEAKAHSVGATALARLGRVGACEAALDRALAAARQAEDRRRANAVLAGAPLAALWGPSPVTRASGRCLDVVRVLRITQSAPAVEAVALSCQGLLEALRGRTEAARRMVAAARDMVEELGIEQRLHETDVLAARIDLLEGDPAAAEKRLRPAYDGLRALGLGIDAARAGALLARAVLGQRRVEEAEALSRESEALAGDDLQAAIAWRCVRAEALAAKGKAGDAAEAVELARAAVEVASATDALLDRADAHNALAAALRVAGQPDAAAAEERSAARLWADKGATRLGAGPAAGLEGPLADPPAQDGTPARRPVVDNHATAYLGRFHEAWLHGGSEAAMRWVAADVRAEHHATATSLGRDGLHSLLDQLSAADDLRWSRDVLATLGDSLALMREELSWGAMDESQLGALRDAGPASGARVLLVEAGPDHRLRRADFYEGHRLGDAVARLYARHAELLEGSPLQVRATGAAATAAFLSRPYDPAQFAPRASPDIRVRDHRNVGFGDLEGRDQVEQALSALASLSSEIHYRVDDVLAVSPDAMVLLVNNHGVSRDGGAFERPICELVVFGDDGLIRIWERFEPERAVDALARLDELSGRSPGGRPDVAAAGGTGGATALAGHTLFRNKATLYNERLVRAFEEKNWDALLALHSESCLVEDRRPVIGVTEPGKVVQGLRFYFDVPDCRWEVVVLATRGERFALSRAVFRGTPDPNAGPAEIEHLSVDEVDENGISVRIVFLDPGDEAAALAELDALYEAAEGAGRPSTVEFLERVGARDWDWLRRRCASDLVRYDHRGLALLGTARGADAWIENLQALVALAPDSSARTVHVEQRGRAALAHFHWTGTRDGGDYLLPMVSVVELDEQGRFARIDLYDEEQANEATARLREAAAREESFFENGASRTGRAALRAYVDRDLERMRSSYAPDFVMEDRRRIAHLRLGRDEFLEFVTTYQDLEEEILSEQLLASRGEKLAILSALFRFTDEDTGPSDATFLIVLELDDDGRIARTVRFDPEDIELAMAELDQLYEQGEAAGLPAILTTFAQALDEKDWAAVEALAAPDYVQTDRRHLSVLGTTRGSGAWAASVRELLELAPDTRPRFRHVRHSDHAYLWQVVWQGTREGGEFEIPLIGVMAFDADGRATRGFVFDDDDLDDAMACFEDLRNGSPAGEG